MDDTEDGFGEQEARFVDNNGFEHTGPQSLMRKLQQVSKLHEQFSEQRNKDWFYYLEEHDLNCLENRNDQQVSELLFSGLPDNKRREIWLRMIGYQQRHVPRYYEDLLDQAHMGEASFQEIQQDIDRTFPNHPVLQEEDGRDRLKRVLVAYSARNPQIGYCQSMNFVVFFLLMILQSEEEAFWCLTVFVEEIFTDYYARNMIGSQVEQRAFTDLIRDTLPDVASHLDKLGVALPIISMEWFLTLYSTVLLAPMVLLIWDNIVSRGSMMLHVAGLAMLQILMPKILLTESIPEVVHLLQREALLLEPHQYSRVLQTLMSSLSRARVSSYRMVHHKAVHQELSELRERRELKLLREKTGFDHVRLKALREEFNILSRDGTGISFLQFQQVFSRLLPNNGHSDFNTVLERIFQLFDEDGNKMLSFQELISCLSVLYQGSFEEKLHLIFNSFNEGGKSYLSKEEVRRIFDHVYKTFYRPIVIDKFGPRDEEMHEQMQASVLKALAVVDDNGVTLEGLRRMIFAQPLILECFQTSDGSGQGSPELRSSLGLYASESRMRESPDNRPTSLHLLEVPSLTLSPPSSPPPPRPFLSFSSPSNEPPAAIPPSPRPQRKSIACRIM